MPHTPEECDGIMCSACAPGGCKIPESVPDASESWDATAQLVAELVRRERGE